MISVGDLIQYVHTGRFMRGHDIKIVNSSYFGGKSLRNCSKNTKVSIVCGPSRMKAGTNPCNNARQY